MFTNEIDFDKTIITIMDEQGHEEDVIVEIHDDVVIFRQWDEEIQDEICFNMTFEMLKDLKHALDLPEGFYRSKDF